MDCWARRHGFLKQMDGKMDVMGEEVNETQLDKGVFYVL